MTKLEELEKIIKAKTPTTWYGTMNYPFYVSLMKPAPSLSKHDSERPTFWKMQDAEFVLAMANGGAEYLLNEVKRLQAYIAERALKDE